MSGTPPDSPSSGRTSSASQGPPPRARRVDRLIGTLLDGKYKILKKIGEGGMGSVYLANQETIDRKVAIKVLLSKLAEDNMAIRRFEQEAKAISKMQHPNTVTIYDYGRIEEEDGERLFIVMEYLKGSTLTQVLRKESALLGLRAARILRQVCASLADAHGAGIIHRDLKPDNIFLTEVGGNKDWVKVLDFGVAKLADSEAAGTLTQTGMIFGTPKYMSPEQAEGKPIDYRADIYALGVVLYELITGKPPFTSDTPVGLLLKHISEPPRPFSEVAKERSIDPNLEQIVMRALEKHPDSRQQQVTELAAELEQYERMATGLHTVPGRGASQPVWPLPTGGGVLPTEVLPGTLPGENFTPSAIPPPDQVPSNLSDGLPNQHGEIGFVSPETGFATAPAQAPLTAPGLTAPIVATPGPDTFGSELGASLRRKKAQDNRWVWGFAVLVTFGLVVAAVIQQNPQFFEAKYRPAPNPTTIVVDDSVIENKPEPSPTPSLEESASATPEPIVVKPVPQRPKPRPRPRPVNKPPKKPVAKMIKIRFESRPPGARVIHDGRRIGRTPIVKTFEESDDILIFLFEKDGYREMQKTAQMTRDGTILADLKKKQTPVVKASSAPVKRDPPPKKLDLPKSDEKNAVDWIVEDLKGP